MVPIVGQMFDRMPQPCDSSKVLPAELSAANIRTPMAKCELENGNSSPRDKVFDARFQQIDPKSPRGACAGHTAICLSTGEGKLWVGKSGHDTDKGKDLLAILPRDAHLVASSMNVWNKIQPVYASNMWKKAQTIRHRMLPQPFPKPPFSAFLLDPLDHVVFSVGLKKGSEQWRKVGVSLQLKSRCNEPAAVIVFVAALEFVVEDAYPTLAVQLFAHISCSDCYFKVIIMPILQIISEVKSDLKVGDEEATDCDNDAELEDIRKGTLEFVVVPVKKPLDCMGSTFDIASDLVMFDNQRELELFTALPLRYCYQKDYTDRKTPVGSTNKVLSGCWPYLLAGSGEVFPQHGLGLT
ncbi:hypothetical protein RND71_025269 [Anisodus tanguticus]|uniref:Uncharacterized protein n=1 Tax=Anisodus tanguticus TaxID=243964 RepID=A0AAE1RSQ4_9SOLA|nr:hypothetical protein RND71_025269 [Anisodus tanguticus]